MLIAVRKAIKTIQEKLFDTKGETRVTEGISKVKFKGFQSSRQSSFIKSERLKGVSWGGVKKEFKN